MALSGANNEEKIWNYLLEKIGNAYGVAGMMGNLKGESGCEPCSAEMLLIQRYDEDKSKYPNISYLKGWKRPVNNPSNREYNSKRYAKFVDNGTITKEEFIHPRSYTGKTYQYGWAIHQITSPNRKEAFYDFVKSKGKSISNLGIQLQFLVKELKNDYPAVWKVLKSAKSVKEASDVVLTKFEIPADCSANMKNLRASYGQTYYDKYSKKSNFSTNGSSSTASNNASNKITKIESAIKWMENLANDDSHGYCQEHRWGADGDYDCSSAVISAWEQAGVPLKSNGATYTGNLYSVATKLGFKDVTSSVNLYTGSGLVRGDILLNHLNHVAMYCGNGKEVEASINEHGGITGGQPGDQTGKEILIKNYRNYPWNCILRYGNSTATTSTYSNANTSTGSKGSHTVVADSLNVRTWAGMNYPTCSFSPLKYGDKVNIEYSVDGTDGSGKWHFIEYNGLKGFVLAEWIE